MSFNTTWKRNKNTLVFGGVCLKKLNLASLNIFLYLHTPNTTVRPSLNETIQTYFTDAKTILLQ